MRGFSGNNDKVFIIYVDQTVGSAITMFMREISKERPLTHDLIAHLMTALGAKVERVIINDLKNATYYARVIIRAENELQQKKIIELDARPSDCIAMATQQKAPIYVSQEVWDEVDDMSDVLRKMEEEGLKPDPENRPRKNSALPKQTRRHSERSRRREPNTRHDHITSGFLSQALCIENVDGELARSLGPAGLACLRGSG